MDFVDKQPARANFFGVGRAGNNFQLGNFKYDGGHGLADPKPCGLA